MVQGLDGLLTDSQLARASSMQRNNHLCQFQVRRGVVSAQCKSQDSRSNIPEYPVALHFPVNEPSRLSSYNAIQKDADWLQYAATVATQYATLSGAPKEQQQKMVEMMDERYYPLVPKDPERWSLHHQHRVQPVCKCEDHRAKINRGGEGWCIHTAALMWVCAFTVEETPFALFGMRGVTLPGRAPPGSSYLCPICVEG